MERPGKYRRTWCSSSIAAAAHSLPVPLADRPPSGLPVSSSSCWSFSHDGDTEDSGAEGATSKKLTRRRCRWGEDGTTPCGGGWTARVMRRVRDGGGLVSSSRVASSRNRSSTYTALKGHGNESDFLGFLQKLVPHESLTLPFKPIRF